MTQLISLAGAGCTEERLHTCEKSSEGQNEKLQSPSLQGQTPELKPLRSGAL